jgi:lysophospholipase L1-like esterase
MRLAAVVALLAVLASGCEEPAHGQPPGSRPPGSGPPASSLPGSMVALGDSLTVGFAACVVPAPCERNSWATGSGEVVNSHYRRIVAANPAMRGNARNVAAPRATSADLDGQARAALRTPADYVTVLIGGNDACSAGTDERTFRSRVDGALAILRKGMPKARVLVVSIPDVYRLWEIGHTSETATRVWSAGICPPLLANPTSTAPADVARRRAFRDRIDAYNRHLADACEAYGPRCRTDQGAVHRVRFKLTHLAVTDFFHPNVDGQAAIANASYPGRFTW